MGDADIGLIGLAVMGENLVLNLESRGYKVAVFNRTGSCFVKLYVWIFLFRSHNNALLFSIVSKVDAFVAGRAKGRNIVGCQSYEELAKALKTPRKVMILVSSGFFVVCCVFFQFC
jgi:6-phosphogluconate dehydrogenase